MNSQVFTSLQSYWHRRTYQKLENSSYSSKKKQPEIILGQGRRRSWKLKTVSRRVCRLRLMKVVVSPVKLVLRLRDAYVNAMLVLAGEQKRPAAPLAAASKKKRSNSVCQVFKISKSCTEFERRMMIHIYASLVAPSN